MQISRAAFDAYSDAISGLTQRAQEKLAMHIDALVFGDSYESLKAARNEVIDYMQDTLSVYTDASSVLAGDFYSEILEAEKGVLIDSELAKTPSEKSIATSVRGSARHLFGGSANVDAFKEGCLRSLDTYISRAANDTMRLNAVRDGKKLGVRYARVPSGVTCAFCVMLASRGFMYANKATAGELGQYHSRCDCRIIPGVDGTSVEGYDPEQYYKAYKASYDAVKDKYGHASTDDVLREMYKREKSWLNTGKPVPIENTEEWNRLKEHERRAIRLFSENGLKVDLRPIDELAKSNPDFLMNEKIWEMKSVFGNGKHSVNDKVRQAKNQLKNAGETEYNVVLVNEQSSGFSDEVFVQEFTHRLKSFGCKEGLVVLKDGTIKRIYP